MKNEPARKGVKDLIRAPPQLLYLKTLWLTDQGYQMSSLLDLDSQMIIDFQKLLTGNNGEEKDHAKCSKNKVY